MFKNKFICLLLSVLIFYSCSEEETASPPDTRTVLVYMAADNNLSFSAEINIEQMQQSIASGSQSGNLLVYVDLANDVPKLIQITRQGKRILRTYPDQNSASSNVMRAVIDEACSLFPSENYGLVLWSHATAWLPANSSYSNIKESFRSDHQPSLVREPFTKAFAQDGEDGTDWLELADLEAAIPDHRFDFILFDACYMGSVEVIYALRNKANSIIASPTEVLVRGFPYDKIADKLLAPFPDLTEICQIYFDSYNSLNGIEQSASITLVKTAELDILLKIVKEIILTHDKAIPLDVSDIQSYDRFAQHILFDMDDYISRIANKEQLSRFRQQLDRVVSLKLATSQFYFSYDITHFSGLSSYIPQASLSLLNDFYNQLEWSTGLIFSSLINKGSPNP